MNGTELKEAALAAIAAGKPLLVEVLPGIMASDQEGVLDPGMRGYVVGVERQDGFDEVPLFEFQVDLTKFMDFNDPHEVANWYGGDDGKKLVRARGTKNWPKGNTEKFWISGTETASEFLGIVEGGSKLFEDFQTDPEAEKRGETYVQWLERNLELERAK